MRTLKFKQTFHYLFFEIKILLRTLGWRYAERLVKPSPDSDSATWIFREVELRFGNEARNKLWFWFGERKRKSCRFHRALQIQIRPSDPRVGGDARIETRVSSRVSHEERRRRRKKDASSNDQIFFHINLQKKKIFCQLQIPSIYSKTFFYSAGPIQSKLPYEHWPVEQYLNKKNMTQ